MQTLCELRVSACEIILAEAGLADAEDRPVKRFNDFSQFYNLVTDYGEKARMGHMPTGTWQPLLDIYERKDSILIVVELPGVDKDRITVTIEQGVLKIVGYRPKQVPEGTEHVHQMEIPYGHFARYVKLPPCADIEKVEAKHDRGYLTIEIPRKPTQ